MLGTTPDKSERLSADCCIVGGGPAGVMLGYLLARAGVEVVVLEKHADFLRDFRGDTIHPSTLEVMYELGILDEFLKRPHQQARQFKANIAGQETVVADLSHLPTHCQFIAFMPQWDFLDFIAEQAAYYPTFHLRMQAEFTALLEVNGAVAGVCAKTANGPLEVRAELTVGADGRHSTVRQQGGLAVQDLGAPIDVLWMRIPRQAEDSDQPMARFDRGRAFVMLNREDYWQCGYVIRKGGYDQVRERGLPAFRDEIAQIAPFLRGRLEELASWDQVKLLTVAVDRLRQWSRPGLLCIGDAAHAMSPVGGVGINLAIQDAVATANILAVPLQQGRATNVDLHKIQRRREFAAKMTQRMQVFIHNRFINKVISDSRRTSPPWFVRLLMMIPALRRIPARVIGIGFRPEHVLSPDVFSAELQRQQG